MSFALMSIPVVIMNRSKSVTVKALLDDGSTRTYMSTDVSGELILLTARVDEMTVGGARRTFPTEEVSFLLECTDGKTSRAVPASTT